MSLFKRTECNKSLFECAEDEAEKTYFEILKRAAAPEPNDYAKLEELLPYLGITWQQAKKDYEVMQKAAEYEDVIAKGEAADKELTELESKYAEMKKQVDEAKRLFMEKYEQPLNALSLRIMDLRNIGRSRWDAETRLEELKQTYKRAFGLIPLVKRV